MCDSVYSWAIQPVRKLITLRISYCFMKPTTTVAGVNTARKHRLKSYLHSCAYLTITNVKEQKEYLHWNASVMAMMLPSSLDSVQRGDKCWCQKTCTWTRCETTEWPEKPTWLLCEFVLVLQASQSNLN